MSVPARQSRRVLPDAPSRRGWCPGLARPMPTGDGLLARVHPPLGILAPDQARTVADGARRFGNGHIDLTARANLQIRGVTEATRGVLAFTLESAGLGDVRADGGPQRLTLTPPLAGQDPAELIDVPALARGVEAVGRSIAGLPPKTLVVIAGRPGDALPEGDLYAVAEAAGVIELAVAGPDGHRLHATCAEQNACAVIAVLLAAFARTGLRRLRDLSDEQSAVLAATLRADDRVRVLAPVRMAARQGASGHTESFFPPAGPSTIVPDRQALVLDAPFGRCTADGLDRIAALADEIGADAIRLSPTRGFVLLAKPGIRVAAALDGLVDIVVCAKDDPRRRIDACTGAPGCASGSTPTLADAARLADPFRAFAAMGRTLHVSGCAKGCARPGPADLTLVGHRGLYGVTVGGMPGEEPAMDLPIEAVMKRLGEAKTVGLAAAFAPDRTKPDNLRDGRPG